MFNHGIFLENETSSPSSIFKNRKSRAERKTLRKRFSKTEKFNILNISEDLFSYNIPSAENLKFEKKDDCFEKGSGNFSKNCPKGAYGNETIEFRGDKNEPTLKTFVVETYTIRLIFKPTSRNWYHDGIYLCLFKNLYIQVGIPFDPKLFYKEIFFET